MSATADFDFETELANVLAEPDLPDAIAKLNLPRPTRWQYRTVWHEQDADDARIQELIHSAMDREVITPHLSDRLSYAFMLARTQEIAACSRCKTEHSYRNPEIRYLARWLP